MRLRESNTQVQSDAAPNCERDVTSCNLSAFRRGACLTQPKRVHQAANYFYKLLCEDDHVLARLFALQ